MKIQVINLEVLISFYKKFHKKSEKKEEKISNK